MILKRILIDNLRSYEKQEIIFPKGSILLSGDIGTGKTTILLAIEFALFGLQPSQKGASLLRNGAEEGGVTLEFEVDKINVIIKRFLKRSKRSISQDTATIQIGDELFEGSVTEVKTKVLKLLNYPQEFAKKTNLLYRFTVYTPQEEMKQIILEPGDIRLNTLRHVFGIDKYKRIEENIVPLTSKIREKIRINEGILYNLENQKENLNKKKIDLENQKIKKIEIEKNCLILIKEREKKEKLLEETKAKIEEKKVLENEKSKSKILISEKEQQRTDLRNYIKDNSARIEDAKKIRFNMADFDLIESRLKFQEDKEESLQKDYFQVIGKINSELSKRKESELLKNKIIALKKCPTCFQEVSNEYKSNILNKTQSEIDFFEMDLKSLENNKQKFAEELENVKKTKQEYKKQRDELNILKIRLDNLKEKEKELDDKKKQLDSMNKDIELLEKHVKTIDSSIIEFSKYDEEYSLRLKELNKAKENETSYAIKKAEISKEIQFLDRQIKEISEDIEKKEKLKISTEKIRELEYWLSKKFLPFVLFTEKQVMLTLKEEFSKLFSKWFAILVSDSLFAKLDENFSPIIEQYDYELDYSFLSGGERTAIALAYRLSLNQVINSLLSHIKTKNLVILDEPTDGFSSQQLSKMRDVLVQLNVEQLILVSHEQKIESFVDNIIKLKKEGRYTEIE
jgi:DNA repair protein SbcC/Rad50